MNDIQRFPEPAAPAAPPELPTNRKPAPTVPATKWNSGRNLLGLAVILLLVAALAFGLWRHYSLHAQVIATAEQRQDFVPTVRTAAVHSSGSTMSVTWPGTTDAFAQANIYARASGYISKREVDIGSHV